MERSDPVIPFRLLHDLDPYYFILTFLSYVFPTFSLFLSFLKKEEGQENSQRVLISNFSYNSIPVVILFLSLYIKNKKPSYLSCCVNTGSIKMVSRICFHTWQISYLKYNRNNSIQQAIILVKLVFHCFFCSSSCVLFSYQFSIFSLFIRRKIKEDLRKVQGTKFGSLHFGISLCIFFHIF